MSLESPRHTNLAGGKPPEVSNIVEMIKNSFSEFKGDNGAISASGNARKGSNKGFVVGPKLENT
jgi:hypothetical protein